MEISRADVTMIQQAFQHHSARVIALSRAALASFFTLALWLESTQTQAPGRATFLLLLCYSVWAIGNLAATWNSWWRESRLSPYAHLIDLAVFTLLVFLTEGYTSPFFTFFVFLVLSASIRWGWREALLTTVVVVLLFLGASFIATMSMGIESFEVERFVVRGANLIVLSFMIIWLGVNRPGFKGGSTSGTIEEADAQGPPARQAMEFAAAHLGASRILLAWSEPEEPWLNVWSLEVGHLEKERHGPTAFPDLVDERVVGGPFIFDVRQRRALFRSGRRRLASTTNDTVDAAFAVRFNLGPGLAIPFEAAGYEGWLFASSVPGLCSDDLAIAADVGEQVSVAFERYALFDAYQESAASRSRLLLARDLHDSVVQFLAGMSLKIQSLTRDRADTDPLKQNLDDLQHQLADEQEDLRKLLLALREPSAPAGSVLLTEHLLLLAKRLEQQWGVHCEVGVDPKDFVIERPFQQEIELLVREAVANAVKHGSAQRVSLKFTGSDKQLRLQLSDDGIGFPDPGSFDDSDLRTGTMGPRSLYDRVQALGGSMQLSSHAGAGSQIMVQFPMSDPND